MVIGTSAIVDTEIDGAVGMNSGIFNNLLSEGKYAVTWAFNYTPNVDSWRATVVTALAAYSADQSDANWQQVVSAFVDGWAIEYNVVNG